MDQQEALTTRTTYQARIRQAETLADALQALEAAATSFGIGLDLMDDSDFAMRRLSRKMARYDEDIAEAHQMGNSHPLGDTVQRQALSAFESLIPTTPDQAVDTYYGCTEAERMAYYLRSRI